MKTAETNLDDKIRKVILDSYKQEAEEIFEEQKQLLIKKLDEMKNQFIVNACVKIDKLYSVQTFGQEIRITFLKEL